MIYETYPVLLFFILALGSGKTLSLSIENIQKSNDQSLKKYKRNYLWLKKAFHGFPKIMKHQ